MSGFDYNRFMERLWAALHDPHIEFSSTGDSLVVRVQATDKKRRVVSVVREYTWLHLAALRDGATDALADCIIWALTQPVGWTKSPPTAAGFYWGVDRDTGCVQIVEAVAADDEVRLFTTLGGRVNPLDYSWWSEDPVEHPEAPDE